MTPENFEVAKEAIDHLNSGKMLVFIAIPNDKTKQIVSFAVDLKGLYEIITLPGGCAIQEMIVAHEGVKAEPLITAVIAVISAMSESVGGATIEVNLAVQDIVKQN